MEMKTKKAQIALKAAKNVLEMIDTRFACSNLKRYALDEGLSFLEMLKLSKEFTDLFKPTLQEQIEYNISSDFVWLSTHNTIEDQETRCFALLFFAQYLKENEK